MKSGLKIKTGDVLLVDSHTFLGNAIDKFQGNRFNHAGFFIDVYEDIYIVESVETGVGFTLFTEYLKKYEKKEVDLLICRPKNDEFDKINTTDLMRFILPKTKLGYDYVNLFWHQVIKYIAKKIGFDLWVGKRKIKAHTRFICGEWVAYIYNYYLGWFSNWNKVAPVDIFNNQNFKHIHL